MKELQEIFARYHEGKTNADETAFVNRYYEYFEKNALFSETITENERSAILDEKWQAMLQWINQKQQAPVHRVHFLRTAWFRSAAAILLILTGVALYYIFSHTSQPENKVVQNVPPASGNDVQPGFNRAVLTLSDGQKVTLDNAASETITDGTLSIKNSNGQLSYTSGGTLSPAGGSGAGGAEGGSREARTATNTMSTPRGGQYKLTLSDGSLVWLNAASSITYPIAFKGATREVSITGEAYFEIKKNPSKPFMVKTPGEDITVLGTSFNVNSYPDEIPKTSLLEGSVRISPAGGLSSAGGGGFAGGETGGGSREARTATSTGIILKPGQAFTNGKVIQTNIEQDIAWKNGVFAFKDADIKAVMRQLARWYDVDIYYEGKIPAGEFTGDIGRNLSLSKVLSVLSTYGITYRIENKKIIISD